MSSIFTHVRLILLAGLFILTSAQAQQNQSSEFVVRHLSIPDDTRFQDLLFLLERALTITEPTHGSFRLEPVSVPMSESRQLKSLKNGQWLDVVWSSTSAEKEQEYLPVRVPLRQGLLGYRLLIVNKHHSYKVLAGAIFRCTRLLTLK